MSNNGSGNNFNAHRQPGTVIPQRPQQQPATNPIVSSTSSTGQTQGKDPFADLAGLF